jgi:hypothetical protein
MTWVGSELGGPRGKACDQQAEARPFLPHIPFPFPVFPLIIIPLLFSSSVSYSIFTSNSPPFLSYLLPIALFYRILLFFLFRFPFNSLIRTTARSVPESADMHRQLRLADICTPDRAKIYWSWYAEGDFAVLKCLCSWRNNSKNEWPVPCCKTWFAVSSLILLTNVIKFCRNTMRSYSYSRLSTADHQLRVIHQVPSSCKYFVPLTWTWRT